MLPAGDSIAQQEASRMLQLLCEVGKEAGSASELSSLIEQITLMTQHTLDAEASSVLLLDDRENELQFEVAEGEAGEALRKSRLSARSGIAGWVALHGEPVLANDVSRDVRFDHSVDAATGFVTHSILCVPLVVQHNTIGVIEVLNKQDKGGFTPRDREVLTSVAATAAMSIENARLHQRVLASYKSTIKALAAAIDAKDPYTSGHSQRVMEYALLGGTSLHEDRTALEYAGLLHDIGKIGISDSILSKRGPLSFEEWDIMHRHPLIGANILSEIPFLEKARGLVLHHHERYDGSGYPDGLAGEEIPLGSRLLSVADAFDTMTTERSYRTAVSADLAVEELRQCTGSQFCPRAVEAFINGLKKNPQ